MPYYYTLSAEYVQFLRFVVFSIVFKKAILIFGILPRVGISQQLLLHSQQNVCLNQCLVDVAFAIDVTSELDFYTLQPVQYPLGKKKVILLGLPKHSLVATLLGKEQFTTGNIEM